MRILAKSVLPTASLNASTTASGSNVNNLSNGNLFDFWSPSTVATQIISVTFNSPTTIDAIGIAGHNLFSSGILSVTVSLFNVSGALLSSDVITITSDKVILFALTSNIAASATITFTVISSMPYVSSIYLGQSVYTVRSPAFGDELPFVNNESSAKTIKSQLGVVLGKLVTVPSGIKMNLSLKNIDLSWVISDWVPFVETSVETPFFITLSDTIGDVMYALAESKSNPKYPAPNVANIRMAYSGVLK